MTMFIDAPDISPHRSGNTGIDYVHTFDSGLPGPHVCINALTHGNEICGAWAVDALLREQIRPACGSLSLSFSNVRAYADYQQGNIEESRWGDEDFNRLWDENTLNGPRQSAELTRAREMRSFFASVDYLLDLHSMHTPGPAMGLCGATRGGLDFARRIAMPGYIVIDSGHSAGRRLRDFSDFGDEAHFRQSYLVECGFHFDLSSIRFAGKISRRFLDITGVCPGLDPLPTDLSPPQIIRITHAITICSSNFRFTEKLDSMQVIPQAGTLIAIDDDSEIRTPHDHCVIVMPAPDRYILPGMTAVRLGMRTE